MGIKRVLEATTSAAQSEEFVHGGSSNSIKILNVVVGGLAGAETATLQKKNYVGAWVDVYTPSFVGFTANLNTVAIIAPGTYRVDKDATAAAGYVDVGY